MPQDLSRRCGNKCCLAPFRETPDFCNFKDLTMTTRITTSFAIAMLALTLGACSSMSRHDQNTAVGAAIGGVAGAVLTGGSTIGTVGGAVVGGVIGSKVDAK